jgi:hypothetical protein
MNADYQDDYKKLMRKLINAFQELKHTWLWFF